MYTSYRLKKDKNAERRRFINACLEAAVYQLLADEPAEGLTQRYIWEESK
jgi:hypothetical protein